MAYAHRGETADQRIAERPMDAGQGQAWVIVDRARLGNLQRNTCYASNLKSVLCVDIRTVLRVIRLTSLDYGLGLGGAVF